MAYTMIEINDEQHTCDCCGKKNLKRVVVLRNTETGAIVRYGVDCAAKAMRVKSSIVKDNADMMAWAQKWVSEGYAPAKVAQGISNKWGFYAQFRDESKTIFIHGVGELAL